MRPSKKFSKVRVELALVGCIALGIVLGRCGPISPSIPKTTPHGVENPTGVGSGDSSNNLDNSPIDATARLDYKLALDQDAQINSQAVSWTNQAGNLSQRISDLLGNQAVKIFDANEKLITDTITSLNVEMTIGDKLANKVHYRSLIAFVVSQVKANDGSIYSTIKLDNASDDELKWLNGHEGDPNLKIELTIKTTPAPAPAPSPSPSASPSVKANN